MMRSLVACLALVAVSAHADDVRVYQTDAYGHIQYHKPSYTIKSDGRVIQTDAYGNKQYGKPQLVIKGGESDQTDQSNNKNQQATKAATK